MAFFDKLGEIAKNVSDKTSEMIEVNKYNQKITSERAKVYEAKGRLGSYYWDRFCAGEQLEPEAAIICAEITALNESINSLQAELEAYKASEAAAAPAQLSCVCPSCQAPNDPQSKFCKSCGAKMEQSTGRFCPSCGKENAAGTKFCNECGAKISD